MLDILFLTQSDTTAGFLSKNKNRIIESKNKAKNVNLLREVDSIIELKKHSRIPYILGRKIRRMKKTTFIFESRKSFRVVHDPMHNKFLSRFKSLYSSSANLHKERFNYNIAYNLANVVVIDKRGIYESSPSNIFKVRKIYIKKMR